jgi:hypothetical protein
MTPLPTLWFEQGQTSASRVLELIDEQCYSEGAFVQSMRIVGVGIDVSRGMLGKSMRALQPDVVAGVPIEREKRVCPPRGATAEIDHSIGAAIGNVPPCLFGELAVARFAERFAGE